MTTSFDATSAVMSYLRARKSAPEDDIIRAVEAGEEAHYERRGIECYDNANLPALLYDLVVNAKRLRWADAPGKKGDLSAPLVYSVSRRERRSVA